MDGTEETTPSVPGTEIERHTVSVPAAELACMIAHVIQAAQLFDAMKGKRWMKELSPIWMHVGEAKFYAVQLEDYLED